MIAELRPDWDVVARQVARDVEIVVLPNCDPIVVAFGKLVEPEVLSVMEETRGIASWWEAGDSVSIGAKVYGDTVVCIPFAKIDRPDWRLIGTLGSLGMFSLLMFDGSKSAAEIDRARDVQHFIVATR